MSWIIILLIIIILLFLIRKFCNSPTTSLSKSFKDSVIIVTGSSAGIGKETALELLRKGATVIFACRSEDKAFKVINTIKDKDEKSRAVFMKIDLSSFASVRNFVKEFTSHYNKLDILVNNAGQINENYTITADGNEQTMQSNHISVTYLTSLLLPIIQKSKGRVVSVGSDGHFHARYDIKEWENSLETGKHEVLKNKYNGFGFGFYTISKIGNNFMTKFFTKYAESYLNNSNYTIPFVTVHPGVVRTEIAKFEGSLMKKLILVILIPFQYLVFKDEFVGAQTTLHCCYLDYSEIIKGGYYANCKVAKESDAAKNKENMISFMKYTFNAIRKVESFDFNENLVLQ
jgi:retinol dehydrogenase-12